MLGHIYKGCELYDEVIPEAKPPYGLNLRASLIKSKRRGWQTEKQEERMLVQAFKDSRKNKKAKRKLQLNNSLPQLIREG